MAEQFLRLVNVRVAHLRDPACASAVEEWLQLQHNHFVFGSIINYRRIAINSEVYKTQIWQTLHCTNRKEVFLVPYGLVWSREKVPNAVWQSALGEMGNRSQ